MDSGFFVQCDVMSLGFCSSKMSKAVTLYLLTE